MASACPCNVSCSSRILQSRDHLPISYVFCLGQASKETVGIHNIASPHATRGKAQEHRQQGIQACLNTFFSMNTMIHPSQDCSGECTAFEEESSLFKRKNFWQTTGQREVCLLLWHTREKGPTLQCLSEIRNSSPSIQPCR